MNPDDHVATWRPFNSLWLGLAVALMAAPFVWLGWEGMAGRAPGGSPRGTFGVGLGILAGAAFLAVPRPRKQLRVTRASFLVNGWPRDRRRWSDETVIAGMVRAGSSRAEAMRFAAVRHARLTLAARPEVPFTDDLLRGADALARVIEPPRGYWPYAALLEPDAPARVCLTPEAARVAAATTSPSSVFVLAGYTSGPEAALSGHGAVVRSLELVNRDPFMHEAQTTAHYGGALSAMDGGDLDDLAASVQHHRSRSGATATDRQLVPEVDVCLMRQGPASDAVWPARLATLFAYRTVAGPRTDLEARVFAVLRAWQDRAGSDAFTAFTSAWRVLMAQPADGTLRADVTWPDGLTPPA